jgi:magnesium-transporting ATPase (P-type)
MLFAAAAVTALMGNYIDTAVILLVAFINTCIGFFQERKAEQAIENIKNMLPMKAQVIREGIRSEIDSENLTLGDIVLLNPGDKVPADLRLLKTNNLKIEESPLTGESLPTNKSAAILEVDVALADRRNMAFSGTSVRTGTALGIVTAIGIHTEIGKINSMLSDVKKTGTPLLQQLSTFSTTISFGIIAIAAAIFAFGYFFRDYPTSELLLSVIGLALAAVPECLPAILSIILALGVQSMAKKKAIVRHLQSVETLGSVSVICSDKTGTLTKNEMTVKTVQTREKQFQVQGSGYQPEGEIQFSGADIDFANEVPLNKLITCLNICNDATLGKDENGNWMVNGNPTEGALVTLYKKARIEHRHRQRLSTIPFDSEYKYMAVLVEGKSKNIIFVKGAPDKLIKIAKKEFAVNGEQKFSTEFWEAQISELANRGQRVIGAGYAVVDKTVDHIYHENVDNSGDKGKGSVNNSVKIKRSDFVFLGLAGIIDPPREEVIDAVRVCKEAGITVKMLTGDHEETAATIGRELGIGSKALPDKASSDKALSGKEIEAMSDNELATAVQEFNIFARTSPEHKIRIVGALQASGTICAMTGDGVNDAPALKKANVGIAMGIKGTDVTKDVADIILVDDNFTTIALAVLEGRRVYANLRKTILFILPTNGAESFLIIASILFAAAIPMTPVQILWVNMITSITLSFALAFERAEPWMMKRPPRKKETPILTGYSIWRICYLSVLIGGGTLAINEYLLSTGESAAIARTVTMQTIIITQAFHLFNIRNTNFRKLMKNFFSNPTIFAAWFAMLVLQAAVTYIPLFNNIFGTVPLRWHYWLYPFAFGFAVFVIVEIEKIAARKLYRLFMF